MIEKKLLELQKSKFRSSFHLNMKDINYLKEKGYEQIKEHAKDFIRKRLKDKEPFNDGKQTPFKGHPVFISQHATATCCRSCLEKWHHIPKGRELTIKEQDYIVKLIMSWLTKEYKKKKNLEN